MKNFISCLCIAFSFTAFAQRGPAKMAPEYAKGYYVNLRGDTLRGKIQTNPDDHTSFYREFYFLKGKSTRHKVMKTNLVRAYGFEDRNFVMVMHKGERLFVERLASGRLAFYEYRYHGKVDGEPAVESSFFVTDTWADANVKIKEPVMISQKFYKKSLKPFMKEEQPIIWEDLDKFTFNQNEVVKAIEEFNSNYKEMAN